jgi:hypothetical protein
MECDLLCIMGPITVPEVYVEIYNRTLLDNGDVELTFATARDVHDRTINGWEDCCKEQGHDITSSACNCGFDAFMQYEGHTNIDGMERRFREAVSAELKRKNIADVDVSDIDTRSLQNIWDFHHKVTVPRYPVCDHRKGVTVDAMNAEEFPAGFFNIHLSYVTVTKHYFTYRNGEHHLIATLPPVDSISCTLDIARCNHRPKLPEGYYDKLDAEF